MSKKNMYMTIDTETVGGASTPTGAYNYGGVIHDKTGHIYATFSILVMEHYDEIAKDDYAKRNFPIYRERLDKGDITAVASEDDAMQIIRNLCRFYHVDYVMAYNTGFDFCKTKCKELLDEFEFIDIYLMALQTITHLKSYRQFCVDNEKWSASGKTCSTTAESVFGFINQNAQYVEEHTALNDALIEMAIFARCAAMKKRYTKNIHMWDCKERNKCFPKRQKMVQGVAQATPYSASWLGVAFPNRACAKFFQIARANCQKLNKEIFI